MPEKYEFLHGRFGLALLYGWVIGAVLTMTITSIIDVVYALEALFDRSVVFAMCSIMIPLFFPIFYMMFFPPARLRINLKCTGILHDDYVEIHKGRRIRIQRYEDIKHVYSTTYRSTTWRIGRVSIHEAIGIRRKHTNSDAQLEAFAKAVQDKTASFRA